METLSLTVNVNKRDIQILREYSLERILTSRPFLLAAARSTDGDVSENYTDFVRTASSLWYCASNEALVWKG